MKKGEFKRPKGVAYSCKGYIIVADSENHRVQVFNEDGRFLRAFGSQGNQEGKVIRIKLLQFFVRLHVEQEYTFSFVETPQYCKNLFFKFIIAIIHYFTCMVFPQN